MINLEHLPPQNIEAEKYFLSACMIDNTIVKHASVKVDDFYFSLHGKIYDVMRDLVAKAEPIDIVTLYDRFKGTDGVNTTAASMISEIASIYPTAANWKSHEQRIIDSATKRKIMMTLQKAYDRIREGDVEIEDIVHDIRNKLGAVNSRRESEIVSYNNIILQTIELVETRSKTKSVGGIPTGFYDVDQLTDGFQPGEIYIVAGRPGMGKTALAKSFLHAAGSRNIPAGNINLEMGETQIAIRALAEVTNIPLYRLRAGVVFSSEWNKVTEGAGVIAGYPLFFSFSAFSDRQISNVIDRMVIDKKCRLIVVDYLQLAILDNRDQKNREREVSEVTRMLKQKALELRIPIVALAQINRSCEQRLDKRPVLSDLRESGDIENHADVVIFIYRDEYYNKNTKSPGIAELIFRKGRNIPADTIRLQWNGKTTTFHNLMKGQEDE